MQFVRAIYNLYASSHKINLSRLFQVLQCFKLFFLSLWLKTEYEEYFLLELWKLFWTSETRLEND